MFGVYSPRLPAEKRLEQADLDPVSFPRNQPHAEFCDAPPPALWARSLEAAANRCRGGSRLLAAPTEGGLKMHEPLTPLHPVFVSFLPISVFCACSFPQPTTGTPLWDGTPPRGRLQASSHILHALGRPGCRGGARKRSTMKGTPIGENAHSLI